MSNYSNVKIWLSKHNIGTTIIIKNTGKRDYYWLGKDGI